VINLDQIEPSTATKQRATSAGLDLERLKLEQPEQFMMFVAEPVLEVSEALKELTKSVFYAAFPQHQLFQVQLAALLELKAFPPLAKGEQERLLSALGKLVEHPKFAFPLAYLRTIKDTSGERHQFALPLATSQWQGQLNHLVGPFESEELLKAWAAKELTQAFDSLRYKDYWFCDVFEGA
jgi:hypothetical protein